MSCAKPSGREPPAGRGAVAARSLTRRALLATLLLGSAGALFPWPGSAGEPGASLAARYRVTVIDADGMAAFTWLLYRRPAEVVAINVEGSTAEIWRRDGAGEVTLARVFEAHRKVVEYSPGELRLRGIAPAWAALGSVIDPARVVELPILRTETVLGRRATVRALDASNNPAQLTWLDEEKLPARVEIRRPGGRVRLELQELAEEAGSGWPQLPPADVLRAYEHVDIADFGDRHGDPFVGYVERLDARGLAGGYFTHGHWHR